MRQRLCRAVLAGALTSFALPAPAQTGSTVQDNLRLSAEAIRTQRRVLVAGSLPLTEEQGQAFWPLYDDYHAKLAPLTDRRGALIAEVVEQGRSLSAARARDLLVEALALEESELKLKKRHMERLQGLLPPLQVALYYQLESKLDALVRADLANAVPLIGAGQD